MAYVEAHMARRTSKPKRATAEATTSRALKRLTDDFTEWRYQSEAPRNAYVWITIMSLGGLALGAGVYAYWLADNPIAYAPYILAAGVVLVAAYLFLGAPELSVLRVGELGVGVESDDKVERSYWHEVESVSLRDGTLIVKTAVRTIQVPSKEHAGAARRIVAEALARLPKRVELADEEISSLGTPHVGEGEKLDIEPPQVTNDRCAASDKPLTFEKDVRVCGRCAAFYHKSAVPSRCVACGKKLKRDAA